MNLTPPDRMEPQDIVAEIGTLQRDLQARFARLQGLSQSLYQKTRRAPADDNTAVYMRFATIWSRFAGMASQGVKRASVGDRVLKGLAQNPIPAESFVKKAVKQAPTASTPVESLLDMYSGDSGLTDADIQSVVDGDASEAD